MGISAWLITLGDVPNETPSASLISTIRGGPLRSALAGERRASLSHGLLADPRLYDALFRFDDDLATEAHEGGCVWCGGRLHRANYPRKPRGSPAALGPDYDRRFSFCCDRDACRKRTTPPSVRFLGRRVYLAAVFVLASAMRHGITAVRAAKLTAWLGVSRRTLGRWRRWWLQTFVASEVWKRVCGRLIPAPAVDSLPASWLDAMGAMDEVEQVQWILAWLLPLSTTSPGKGSRILMGF